MWFGAGFSIEFQSVEEAAKYKPEIEEFLSERLPNVWAGKTSRKKAVIKVPMREDSEVIEGADDVRGLFPAGRQQHYSDMFYDLYCHFLKNHSGAIISAVAEYEVYDSYSRQVLCQREKPREIDYDLVLALNEEYNGDYEAIADELDISVEEVAEMLGE